MVGTKVTVVGVSFAPSVLGALALKANNVLLAAFTFVFVFILHPFKTFNNFYLHQFKNIKMHLQNKIHIPPLLNDNRNTSTVINPILKQFATRITTVRFQIVLMIVMGLLDCSVLIANGVWSTFPQFLVFFAIETAFFFAYVHFILPRLASSSYNLVLILGVLALSLLVYDLLHLLVYVLYAEDPWQFLSNLSAKFVINPLYRAFQRLVFSIFLWSAYVIRDAARREQVLENNVLFSRISPHLLFNALNMLPPTNIIPLRNEKVIELLSGYTRNAMIELGNDGKGQLVNELEQLEILLQINELRFGKLYIQLHKELPADFRTCRIPPQIIISLAENIFKYGIVDDPHKPVVITITVAEGYLTAAMTNYKYPIQEHSSSKIGISSVKKRLAIIYDKNHHFKISETLEVFSIEIGFPV